MKHGVYMTVCMQHSDVADLLFCSVLSQALTTFQRSFDS